jgi:hypothetical protein
MATQIVMDQSGDTRHWFDQQDSESLLKAEVRFRQLIDLGYTAVVRNASGDPMVTRIFDPKADETLFFPRLVGG